MSLDLSSARNYLSHWAKKKSLLYLAIVILVFILAVALIWYFSQKQPIPIIEEIPQPKTKTLTPEEIQEALEKQAEISKEEPPALRSQDIQKALKKKSSPDNTNLLTPEEIQEALNKY